MEYLKINAGDPAKIVSIKQIPQNYITNSFGGVSYHVIVTDIDDNQEKIINLSEKAFGKLKNILKKGNNKILVGKQQVGNYVQFVFDSIQYENIQDLEEEKNKIDMDLNPEIFDILNKLIKYDELLETKKLSEFSNNENKIYNELLNYKFC